MRTIVLVCVAALVAVGCGKKEESAPQATAASAKPTADLPRPPVAIAPPEETLDDDIATEEEFEDAAEKDIVSANLESEVDALAKEIGE